MMNYRSGGLLAGLMALVVLPACIVLPDSNDFVPAENQPPQVVTNGNQSVYDNVTVQLDASASYDPDGDPLTFTWTKVSGPNIVLVGADTAVASFQTPEVTVLTQAAFQVAVSDDHGNTRAVIVYINISMLPKPQAVAGSDVVADPGTQVTLTGYNFGPPVTVTYGWKQIAGPEVTLSDPNSATTSFTLPQVAGVTVFTFEFTVTDETGQSSTDSVDVMATPRVRFKTTMGEFLIRLNTVKAPITVANFLTYVNEGFYVGLIFHRVLPVETDPNDFGGIVQGGGWDPNLNSPQRHDPIKLESNNGLSNLRGTIAMARLGSTPDSATSEFYFNVDDNTDLDYRDANSPGFAVFGEVIEGMDVIEAMSEVATTQRTAPWNPQVIFYDIPVVAIIINEVTLE